MGDPRLYISSIRSGKVRGIGHRRICVQAGPYLSVVDGYVILLYHNIQLVKVDLDYIAFRIDVYSYGRYQCDRSGSGFRNFISRDSLSKYSNFVNGRIVDGNDDAFS